VHSSPAILYREVGFSLWFERRHISAHNHFSSGTLVSDSLQLTSYFWLFQDPAQEMAAKVQLHDFKCQTSSGDLPSSFEALLV